MLYMWESPVDTGRAYFLCRHCFFAVSTPVCTGTPGAVGRFLRLVSASSPTHVGTAIQVCAPRALLSLNPHARGDSDKRCELTFSGRPQPPRTWGQLNPTALSEKVSLLNPHARGDSCKIVCRQRVKIPQPPRTWGQPGGQRRYRRRDTSTPTHVGTARARSTPSTPTHVGTALRIPHGSHDAHLSGGRLAFTANLDAPMGTIHTSSSTTGPETGRSNVTDRCRNAVGSCTSAPTHPAAWR